jgi:hypothetical protein
MEKNVGERDRFNLYVKIKYILYIGFFLIKRGFYENIVCDMRVHSPFYACVCGNNAGRET